MQTLYNLVHLFTLLQFWIGEKIGVEYLYSQTGKSWHTLALDPDKPDDISSDNETLDTLDDEGFQDDEFVCDLTIPMPTLKKDQTSLPSMFYCNIFNYIQLFNYLMDICSF